MNLEKTLEVVKEVAHKAGAYLKEEQSKLTLSSIELKSARNYVTYIDKEAEKIIVSELVSKFPDTGFLTEEGTKITEEKEWTWIIDPLDGTTNYVNGDTPYTVSIALQHNGVTVLGIVYDPAYNEIYCAIAGGEATLNDKPINVSKRDTIEDSYIGFGIPYVIDARAQGILKHLPTQYHKCSFRIKGSAAVELCYVAAGKSDAYFHSGLSPWDVAAGAFILEMAGGRVTDYDGAGNFIFGREIVASNGYIHKEVMDNIINYN